MSTQEKHAVCVLISIAFSILFPAFIYIGRRNDWKCVNLPVLLTGCAIPLALTALNVYMRNAK